MSWHLHITDHPLFAVQLLYGQMSQIAAWTSSQDVLIYDQITGALLEKRHILYNGDTFPQTDGWRAFAHTLSAPNGAFFPSVTVGHTHVFASNDGRLFLYHDKNHDLYLDVDGQVALLTRDDDGPLAAVSLDRELGTAAALSTNGRLHIYQQHIYIGACDVAVEFEPITPVVLLPETSGELVVVDGVKAQVLDSAGKVRCHHPLPAVPGAVACSPDGSLLAIGDRDHTIIRIYDADLNLIRQNRADDLFQRAVPLQLLADIPAPDAPVNQIAIDDDGTFALSIDGGFCLTHVDYFYSLPRTRPLF
ncbi:MAG: hypothetical protein JW966_09020 [Anaerolineae bacterium]|nr:hypothetical protein [Anaerolineae bacterium]